MLSFYFYGVSGFVLGLFTASFRTSFLLFAIFHWFIPWSHESVSNIDYNLAVPCIYSLATLAGCALVWTFCLRSSFTTSIVMNDSDASFNQEMVKKLCPARGKGLEDGPERPRQSAPLINMDDTSLVNLLRVMVCAGNPKSITYNFKMSWLRIVKAIAVITLFIGATLPLELVDPGLIWGGIVTIIVEFVFSILAFFMCRVSPSKVARSLFYAFYAKHSHDLSLQIILCTGIYILVFSIVHWTVYTWHPIWPFWYSLGITVASIVLIMLASVKHGKPSARIIPW